MSDERTRDLPPAAAPTTDTPDPNATVQLDAPAGGTTGPNADPVVPGYRITGPIARGGMGAVYAAVDLTLHREVALKVVLPGGDAGRFVTEARITAKLPHPGIPPVHQLGRLPDGTPFLAMKLIRGRTLADLLADRPGPSHDLPRFVAVFEQIGHAVGYAHAHGVVHRDLKPANVMVGSFGEVQVMDWGLAKDLAGRSGDDPGAEGDPPAGPGDAAGQTAAGAVMGTPAYMAPEQARGEPAGARADVFALGAILCEVLTGERPYGSGPAAVIVHRAASGLLGDAFARLDGCGADAELVALAKRCLVANPDDRPADAGAVAGAVAAYQAGVRDRLQRATVAAAEAAVKAAEERKRRRVRLALAAAVGLLLAGGGGFAWWQEKQAGEQARLEGERNAEAFRRETEARQQAAADHARREENGRAVAGLVGRCEESLRADDADRAAILFDEADRRAAAGGAEHLAGRLARCRADLDTLRELDRIDDLFWTEINGRTFGDEARAAWPVAVRAFGIDPGRTPPDEAARRLAESAIRDRVLLALDRVLMARPSADVLAVLKAADPDPFRDAVRAAVLAGDAARFRELVAAPEATAQPTRFAVAVCGYGAIPPPRRAELLTSAQVARPTDIGVLMSLGAVWKGDDPGTVAERIGCYRAAVAARPTNTSAWNNLALALHARGDLTRSLAAFERLAELDPSSANARVNIGNILYRRRELDRALAHFDAAVRLDPNNPFGHHGRGMVLVRRGDLVGAEAAMREAVRLGPKDARVRANLGLLLAKRGDGAGAVAEYREAIRLDPRYAPAHTNLGIRLLDAGDPDGAIASFQEALRLDPKDADARKGLDLATRAKARESGRLAPPPREVKRP